MRSGLSPGRTTQIPRLASATQALSNKGTKRVSKLNPGSWCPLSLVEEVRMEMERKNRNRAFHSVSMTEFVPSEKLSPL